MAKINILKIFVNIPGFVIALLLCLLVGVAFSNSGEQNYFVHNVYFKNIDKKQQKKILPYLNLQKPGWFRKTKFTWESASLDVNIIENYFQKMGYLSVLTPTVQVDTLKNSSQVDVTFNINPGTRVFIDSITFTGNSLFPDKKLKSILSSKEKNPFISGNLSNDSWNIVNIYAEQGYINTKVQPLTKFDTTANIIKIEFQIDERLPVSLDSIIVQGNKKTKTKVIKRALALQQGKRVNYRKILDSQSNLYALGLFTNVRIELEGNANQKDTLHNILVQVRERQAGEISVGGGYGTDTKERVSFRVSQRNFHGLGQAIGSEIKVSRIWQEGTLAYTNPLFYSMRNSIDINAFVRRLQDPSFTRFIIGNQYTFGRKASTIGRLNASYLIKREKLSDIRSVKIIDSSGTTSSIRLAFVEDRRDNIINTLRGHYLETGVEIAPPYFGNTKSFIRFTLDTRQYRPLNPRINIAWWGNAGMMWQLEKNRPIPVYERFFLGGERSIRGYDRNSVGPSDTQTGLPLGGIVQIVQNLELKFNLVKNFSFITFVDIGNAWDKFSSIKLKSFRTGYGPGIRYSFFLGVVGLDYAWKWNPRPGESPARLHISIGQTF